ncbi:UNVERIFIED_ORG: ABC-2 type transport system permease protein [Heyndrickxia coagulans]
MFVIGKKECFGLLKGTKSLVVVFIFLITAYYSAKFSPLMTATVDLNAREAKDMYTVGILLLAVILGQLFVMGLSHDSINREMHERTMRFLITRTSRTNILLGKYFGILLFWVLCISVSFFITSLFSKSFHFFIFFQTICILTYQVALTIMLSAMISKPGMTMFLSVILGIAFPIVGIWLALTSKAWIAWLKYITPYYYLKRDDWTCLVIVLIAGLMLVIANAVFGRREC